VIKRWPKTFEFVRATVVLGAAGRATHVDQVVTTKVVDLETVRAGGCEGPLEIVGDGQCSPA
jgi:hypothetical protein